MALWHAVVAARIAVWQTHTQTPTTTIPSPLAKWRDEFDDDDDDDDTTNNNNLSGKTRLRNDPLWVECDVKLYTLTSGRVSDL